MSAGRGRANKRATKSARVSDSSAIALYIKCCTRFWRRMSTMNANRGFRFTMYVRFCSGPTPRYTPCGGIVPSNSGITICHAVSLEMKLSERK